MITVCPSCHRQFRIYARQLSAASGIVQCGYCGEQFNALHQLHDQPLPDPVPPATDEVQDTVAGRQEPQFQIPNDTDAVVTGPEQQPAGTGEEDNDHDLAAVILEQEPVPRSRLAVALWIIAVLILLTAGILQAAWFHRDTLLARYPQLLPLATQICERLHCELIRNNNSSAIVVVNRDVRDHPRYQNVLLVNVTIENRSVQTVDYPDILLSLFDTDGNVIGYRQFAPDDYLDETTAIAEGLLSRQPLHIVLEVAGSADEAVGFEFDFL